MLVDLGRNDLGRVCVPGTVQVEDYSHIERYSHVMHLVSTVTGLLAEGKTALDAVTACFPAGTLSGAPKVRAMELIEEVEKTRRGLYGGVVGYLDFAGNADFAIAIRTALMRDGTAYVQAGGGVVADSNGPYEYNEAANKAKAVLSAIAAAGDADRGHDADRRSCRCCWRAAAALWRGVAAAVGRGDGRSTGWASPQTATLNGGAWSTALVPLAAAAAGGGARGRLVGAGAGRCGCWRCSSAAASAVIGLPGDQPVGRSPTSRSAQPVWPGCRCGSWWARERHYWGAVVDLVAAVLTLAAAVLLMRRRRSGRGRTDEIRGSGRRRDGARGDVLRRATTMSERMLWDALDEGRDPTEDRTTEGR